MRVSSSINKANSNLAEEEIHENTGLWENTKPSSRKDAKNKSNSSYGQYIVRFMILTLISMVALFLIVYAAYLISVYHMNNLTNKYNSVILKDNQYFYQISVPSFENSSKFPGGLGDIGSVVKDLTFFEQLGITDVILTDIFDRNFNLIADVIDLAGLESFIRSTAARKIGVFLSLERPVKNKIELRGDDLSMGAYSKIKIINEDSNETNYSCIDEYLPILKAIIKKYSSLGIAGFIIRDLPCCLALSIPHLHDNCTLSGVEELRKTARKHGKPSALIYQPPMLNSTEWIDRLLSFNKTYFDGVISYVTVNEHGGIKVPETNSTASQSSSSPVQGLVQVWQISSNIFSQGPANKMLLKLIYSAVSFIPVSILLKAGDEFGGLAIDRNYSSVFNNSKKENNEFYELINMIKLTKIFAECKKDSSSVIYDYASDEIFFIVTESTAEDATHCAMLINFGDTKTVVNMRTHLVNSEIYTANAQILLVIKEDGMLFENLTNSLSSLTLEPKSATFLQIIKKFG